MNMQTIQIMILLLDGFIKLAPWRIVTETMDRIGSVAVRAKVLRGALSSSPQPAPVSARCRWPRSSGPCF
jgi:hypothetical protein